MVDRLSEFDRRVDRLEARADRLESELAAWRRHGVLVTEDCKTCDGTGCVHREDEMRDRLVAGKADPCCPTCGGTGKVLKAGAVGYAKPPRDRFDPVEIDTIAFPASWLEGASE